MQGNFSSAAMQALHKGEVQGGGYASHDASGNPFPLFRQGAYMFTDFTPAGNRESYYRESRNIPTDTVLANNAMQADGVSQATTQNYAMVNRTQTLETNKYPQGATSPTDPCKAYPGSKATAVHMDWNDAKGNQTTFCSSVDYPELQGGVYNRKLANEGGIGKSCTRDGDCGTGYFCNNETNMFGKNRQQTGFCSQAYNCPDGSKQMAGYPYNAGQPIPPPKDQNNQGRGYANKEECDNNVRGYQDCVQDNNGRWFAVYAQYCPLGASLRKGSNPQGAFRTTPPAQQQIIMPGWGTQGSSGISSAPQAFSAWNINAEATQANEETSPLAYSLSINPRG